MDAPDGGAATPAPQSTPAPESTPNATAQPSATPAPPANIISQIFHYITFPASTISEAIQGAVNQAAEDEIETITEQTESWSVWIGEVVQAPSEGHYSEAARVSLTAAAALAPALFILRLVLYHWGRLVGQEDSAANVIGDWVMAGVAAVAAGPLLDLLARLGWWLAGLALGDTTDLATSFVSAMQVTDLNNLVAKATLFSGIFQLALLLASILGIVGLLFAFLAANSALYVMAILAAPLAVIGVLPQMRWMRGLWLKAVGIIAIIPIVAGGIFRAGMAAGTQPSGGGLLAAILRLMWLLGAAGFMLSLAGILSKITLTAAADAGGKLLGAVKAVVSVAALAMSAGASAGLAAGASAAAAPSGPSSSPELPAGDGGGGNHGGGNGNGGGYTAALGHYQAAQTLTNRGAWLDAFGLRAPAQYNRSLAHNEELEARKNELYERQAALEERKPGGAWGGGWHSGAGQTADGQETQPVEAQMDGISRNLDLSRPVTSKMVAAHGNPENFEQGFNELNAAVQQKGGPDLRLIAPAYPAEVGRMVAAYQGAPGRIDNAPDPLREAAYQGHARGVLQTLGEPADPSWGAMNPPPAAPTPDPEPED